MEDKPLPGQGQMPVSGPETSGLETSGPATSRPGRPIIEPCQEAIATLYNFLDGELTPDRRVQIQHHLDECAPCFDAFDFEAELKALIARKCRDAVPDALRQRVAEALRAEDVRS